MRVGYVLTLQAAGSTTKVEVANHVEFDLYSNVARGLLLSFMADPKDFLWVASKSKANGFKIDEFEINTMRLEVALPEDKFFHEQCACYKALSDKFGDKLYIKVNDTTGEWWA